MGDPQGPSNFQCLSVYNFRKPIIFNNNHYYDGALGTVSVLEI